jgi:small subunit ribosomal protein S19
MPRSLKKGPYVHPSLLEKIAKQKSSGLNSPIKTWSRSSTIIPDMVGITFLVHNGKIHKEVLVSEEMVGHKLGEFSYSTNFKNHGGKNAKVAKK